MKSVILLCVIAAAVAKPDMGYAPAPAYPAPAYPEKPVVHHAPAPTMTTHTIHTYHSPAPKAVVSAPPNYVPMTQAPVYAPAPAPYAPAPYASAPHAPAPSYSAPAYK